MAEVRLGAGRDSDWPSTTLPTLATCTVEIEAGETLALPLLHEVDRALHQKAPFQHEGKNDMADAMIIEMYFEAVRSGNQRHFDYCQAAVEMSA